MKKLVYVLFILFIIGVIGTFISSNSSGSYFSFHTTDVEEKVTVEGSAIQHIELDVSSADVTLNKSSSQDITVELVGEVSKKLEDDFKLNVEENEDTLTISIDEKKKIYMGVTRISLDIIISLPEQSYESIQLRTSSGDIAAEHMIVKETLQLMASSGDVTAKDSEAQVVELKASSGDLLAENLSGAKLSSFKTSSGDIILRNVPGDITAKASSGEILIENERLTGNMTAEVHSGDVDIRFSEKPDSMVVHYKGSSGEGTVDIDGFLFEEKEENHFKGKIGSGAYEIHVETSSGDFSLR
ncbi:DUF4097 domain-containing protein [Cytobacillus spongiae]|jgi:lia operon protein LiaG|uniref:DUF4097 domain-containing protein n=1 Tax=Cytobacillus spongiae TaxID=2901381 RepID=UPI001F1CE31A|nr:DUF4097 domain-containing protein [Cytobacillus spongiae]UII57742.1 DUF4097 domain-containing protein [Cytobacillus spongiae]